MIIKLYNRKTVVLFSGISYLEYKYRDVREPIALAENCLDYINRNENCSKEEANTADIFELWLFYEVEDKYIKPKQVLAYSPVYIMNDEGKTIERL
jgi:hypothetical protein